MSEQHESVSVRRYAWWELIRERAAVSPDRRMLVDDRGRTLTFADFRDRAERIAAGLWEMGVRPGDVVSWQLPTTMEAPLLMTALSRLGVSQNPVIPMLRKAEIDLILGQLASRWYFIPGVWRGFDYRELAAEATAERDCTVVECDVSGKGTDPWGLPQGDPAVLPPYQDATSDSPVRVYLYTSGTTGVPKGVIHTEHSVLMASRFLVELAGVRGDDLFPMAFPYTHVGGPASLGALVSVGGCVMLVDIFDPGQSPQQMAECGATLLGSAVPFFQAYLAAQERHGPEPLFPKLRFGLNGGAPLPPEIITRVATQLHCGGILNAFGLTEFPCATSVTPDDPDWVRKLTVGRPVSGVEARVVSGDGTVQDPGGEGELRMKGPQGFLGYVDATLDADGFDEDGFVRTGDLATIDEHGYIRVTGRLKDVIIRNAENISALEVEEVLYRHPAIGSVAVIGLPDATKGERCCAVVVLAEGARAPSLAELATHCRAAGLATQKAPEQLEIIDTLPLNSMGKVLKTELRARFRP